MKRLLIASTFIAAVGCQGMFQPAPTPAPPMQTAPVPAITILAPAPLWMRPEMLGTPLDAHFQTMQSAGGSIFPNAPITGMQADDFKHELVEVQDTTSFDANISAWGSAFGVQAGMGNTSDYRFAN